MNTKATSGLASLKNTQPVLLHTQLSSDSHNILKLRIRPSVIAAALTISISLSGFIPVVAQAATFNIADGDVVALITAINTANGNGEADTINLASGGTYSLTAIDNADNGLPVITSGIAMNGNGATIERSSAAGTPDFRVIAVETSGDVAITETTIKGGRSPLGSGVYNKGLMTLSNSIVTNNWAAYGAGIYSSGAMTLNNSTVSNNSCGGAYGNPADGLGGGIHNRGTMTLNNSTVSGNTAYGVYWIHPGGGGIYNSNSTMTLNSSTVSGNTIGGGILNLEADLTVINSTISGNMSAASGAGILNFSWSIPANTIIINNTITENKSANGLGDAVGSRTAYVNGPVGSITVGNSIFSAFTGSAFYASGLTTLGHNLVSDNSSGFSGPNDLVNVSPILGPLADNGGPTQTHAPLLGSPVIDAVPLVDCTDASSNPVTTDQRGITRPQGPACDIGAFEFEIAVANDHFLSYEVERTKRTPEFESREVFLKDQFLEGRFRVEKPEELLNPVDKNGEGISDFDTHLLSYKVEELGDLGDFELAGILVENQFGAFIVDVEEPDRLLVPASKSLSELLSPPDASVHNVDHFLCYKIDDEDDDDSDSDSDDDSNDEDAPTVQVLLQDQFDAEPRLFDVKQPKRLCNPVDKNGEGIKNPDNHLLCYQVKPAKGERKHEKIKGIFVNDQFGPNQVDTRKEKQLCVPSTKTLPPLD